MNAKLRALLPELTKFGVVGGAGFATDVLLFLLLRQQAGIGSIPAKVISLAASILVAYLGNRWWTYRDRVGGRADGRIGRETLLFVTVNIGGALIQLACLGISRSVLGFTSATADLVSGSLVGMALATMFRFWGTRTLVFPETEALPRAEAFPETEAPADTEAAALR
ncbi:GtrA family protein [Kitasatospora sp. GP82]|uniref:GtrA family protein n=1 Tax=Kitasatospora sp. GP82 TaxID=3035089 RepID=UPI002476979A|nr:GtrA family protein [Kitasatospora sp. GP82]MDH6124191.1 putative flippase GtrA [Kitasatospora sp. GP82]